MEEEGVIGLGVLNKPVHSTQDVGLGRLAHWVLLVIGQNNHVLTGITKGLVQVGRHVLDVVDTPAQLTLLTEIIDTNQQRLSLASASGVLESVILRSAVTEGDGVARRGWGTTLSVG